MRKLRFMRALSGRREDFYINYTQNQYQPASFLSVNSDVAKRNERSCGAIRWPCGNGGPSGRLAATRALFIGCRARAPPLQSTGLRQGQSPCPTDHLIPPYSLLLCHFEGSEKSPWAICHSCGQRRAVREAGPYGLTHKKEPLLRAALPCL